MSPYLSICLPVSLSVGPPIIYSGFKILIITILSNPPPPLSTIYTVISNRKLIELIKLLNLFHAFSNLT